MEKISEILLLIIYCPTFKISIIIKEDFSRD